MKPNDRAQRLMSKTWLRGAPLSEKIARGFVKLLALSFADHSGGLLAIHPCLENKWKAGAELAKLEEMRRLQKEATSDPNDKDINGQTLLIEAAIGE
jgi:hypothetical protein